MQRYSVAPLKEKKVTIGKEPQVGYPIYMNKRNFIPKVHVRYGALGAVIALLAAKGYIAQEIANMPWLALTALIGVISATGMIVFRREPALLINNRGIYDNSNMLGAGFIEWRTIDTIKYAQMDGARFLAIRPLDTPAFLEQQDAVRQSLYESNIDYTNAPVCIAMAFLLTTEEELRDVINLYKPGIFQ